MESAESQYSADTLFQKILSHMDLENCKAGALLGIQIHFTKIVI